MFAQGLQQGCSAGPHIPRDVDPSPGTLVWSSWGHFSPVIQIPPSRLYPASARCTEHTALAQERAAQLRFLRTPGASGRSAPAHPYPQLALAALGGLPVPGAPLGIMPKNGALGCSCSLVPASLSRAAPSDHGPGFSVRAGRPRLSTMMKGLPGPHSYGVAELGPEPFCVLSPCS